MEKKNIMYWSSSPQRTNFLKLCKFDIWVPKLCRFALIQFMVSLVCSKKSWFQVLEGMFYFQWL